MATPGLQRWPDVGESVLYSCGVGGWGKDGIVFVAYDQAWMDQSSSWWAKANRAKEHIDSLSRLVDEFRALGPYSLTAEPTEKAGRLATALGSRRRFPSRSARRSATCCTTCVLLWRAWHSRLPSAVRADL